MNKITRGAKTGFIPGVMVGILSFPLNYYLLAIKYRDEISNYLGKPYAPSMHGLIIISIGTTVILTICGILYVQFYEKLPSKTPFWKAFLFGLVIFVVSRLGDIIVDYPVSQGLVIDNALFSAPLLLFFYPYLVSKLYGPKKP
jgi:hypothetical protein